MKIGFNNELYVKKQTERIKERIKMFDNKLYLEFGGKLLDDYHAKRVLPGFELNAKIRLLEELKDQCEIIFCINAKDINKKIRADYGITYDMDLVRIIKLLSSKGINTNSVVITMYKGQVDADKYREKLEEMGIKTYVHTFTKGYPTDVDTIVSEEGYGANEYIKTTKPLVIVNAPGPCSGKLATCLSQLYHEYKRGIKAGYAKFETFPVWDLPLKHPINLAYEAATADLKDVNMIDNFHLDAYGVSAVNYNRDIEVFPVLKNILHKITNDDIYKSPTDMGVNSIGSCITDDEIVRKAACKEIVRRYYKALVDCKIGNVDRSVVERIKLIMNELKIDKSYLPVIGAAYDKSNETDCNAIALELEDGKIVTGRETDILTPVSAMFLNVIKEINGIEDGIHLLSPNILEPILKIKNIINSSEKTLNLNEVLIALSISSVTNPIINDCLNKLYKLENCDVHATYIIDKIEADLLRKLKINYTTSPKFFNEN